MRSSAGQPNTNPSEPLEEVVFVCTANRARSPFAAALLRRHLSGARVVVESYGTLDVAGEPALGRAMSAAQRFDVDLSTHRSRTLPSGGLRAGALVLGFEPYHVAAAVMTGGASKDRAFLLGEFAELLGADDLGPAPDRDEILRVLGQLRSRRDGLPPRIADPAGRSERVFLETFHRIDRSVAVVARKFFGAEYERATERVSSRGP